MADETGSVTDGLESEGELRTKLQHWSREDASTAEPGDPRLPVPFCRCGICNDSFTSRIEVSEHIKSKHYKWALSEFRLENHMGDDLEYPISDLIELPSACGRASFFFPDFDDIDKFLRLSSAEAISNKGEQVLISNVLNDESPTCIAIDVIQSRTGTDTSLTSVLTNSSRELQFYSLDDCADNASIIVPKTASSGDVCSGGTSKEDASNSGGTNDSTGTSGSVSRSDNGKHMPHPNPFISIHDDIRYLCELCGSKYVSFGTCSLHMRTVHRRTPMLPAALQNSPMKQIEQAFRKDFSHNFSDKYSNNGPKPIFICSLCGDSFLSLQHCSKHFKMEHKRMEKHEQILASPLEESTFNGLPKVQQVKREEHDRETTLDLLLKLTQLILARYEPEERDGDDWDTDGQEIGDGLVEDAATSATCHMKDVQFSAEEDCGSRVNNGIDAPVLSGGKPEHGGGELFEEQTELMYRCFVCPERFPSFRDCGRHMISEHAAEEDKWGEVLGLHQMTLDQLKKIYQVPDQHLTQNTNRGFRGEHSLKVCAIRSDERRQEGMSSHEDKGSEQLHGHTEDVTFEGELREELHHDIAKEIDDDITQSEQPSPKKMKLRPRAARSKDLKVSSLNQKVVPQNQRMQKVNQQQRKHKKEKQTHPKKALSFQCPECSEIFSSASGLDKHIGRMHCGVSSLKCQKCAQYASTPADEKYRSILEEITAAKDAILSRGYKKKGGAEKIQHYFECVVCGDGFRCKVHFDKHPSCHVEYVCQMCHQDFPSFTALSMHVHSHNCGPLPCKDCGKTFYNTKSWLDHVLQHNNELQCDICHITFSNPQNLTRHNITKHSIGKKDSFECGECGKKFHFRYKYLLHIQNVHGLYDPDNNTNYLCDHCGVKLKSASNLRQHVLTHQDVFTCEDCGCWFKEQSQLDLHKERAHQNTTLIAPESPTSLPSRDSICPTATITETSDVLQEPKEAKERRKQKQSSGLTYKCSYCKTYFRSLKLKIGHERRHKGVAFQCGKCDTLLPSFEDYGKHLRSHHELPEQLFYKCNICPKRFQAPWQLERHTKKHQTCKKCGETFEKVDLLLEHLSTNDHCADHVSAGKFTKHTTERPQSKPHVSKRSKHSPADYFPASPDASSPPAIIVAAQENVPFKVSSNRLPMDGIERRKKVSDDDEATSFLMSLAGIVGS